MTAFSLAKGKQDWTLTEKNATISRLAERVHIDDTACFLSFYPQYLHWYIPNWARGACVTQYRRTFPCINYMFWQVHTELWAKVYISNVILMNWLHHLNITNCFCITFECKFFVCIAFLLRSTFNHYVVWLNRIEFPTSVPFFLYA